MAKLYPPNLEGTLPAFYGTTLVVPFSMNRAVTMSEVQSILLKIKTIQSNSFILAGETENFSLSTSHCEAQFGIEPNKLNIGQYYKIQIAYKSNVDQIIGYYSTVGVIKYTAEPRVEIDGLSKERGNINSHRYSYVGKYTSNSEDPAEKVYSYQFNLYDTNKQLLQTSGEQIHNSYNDTERGESYDNYNIEQDLELNQVYYLEYIVTTLNGLKVSSGYYKIMQKQSIKPEIEATLVPTLNFENGYVNLTLVGKKNSYGVEYTATGSYRIMRSSTEDDFKTWNEVLRFDLYGQKPSKWIWRDFTVKQGVTYKYALQQYNEKITSNRLESAEIYVDFEHVFLFDGKRQLKLKYNPKVSSLKNNILEQRTNTIGSKYPFIFRNGNVKYKEFPFSGLISCRSDEEFLFVDEEVVKNYDQSINLISANIQTERDFKFEVLEWLNNGEPKVFRSPGEGNYIVRLMNISMTPNDTTGRMLHTVAGTAVEIADWSYAGLEEYGFIQTEDPTTKQIRWETVDLSKDGIGSADNILNYRAIALRFDGMVPGDRVFINDGVKRDGSTGYGIEIVIGATGYYEVDLSAGMEVSSVRFSGSYDNVNDSYGGVRHQGTLTYAYYSQEKNRFSSIEDIQIQDIPLMQFIGEHDVLTEVQDVKTQIQGLYWLHATKRELYSIYKIDGKYYVSNTTNSDEITEFDSYTLYQVTDGNEVYYYDPFAEGEEEDKRYEVYEPYIIFNDQTINVDLTETYEFKTKNLEDLKNLQIKNGVILEVSFQRQIVEYSVENTKEKYPEILELKDKLDKIASDLYNSIFNSDNSDSYNDVLRQQYKTKYQEYIKAVTEALEKEEAVKGDIIDESESEGAEEDGIIEDESVIE